MDTILSDLIGCAEEGRCRAAQSGADELARLRAENEALRAELKECREKLPEPNSVTMPRSVYEMMRKRGHPNDR